MAPAHKTPLSKVAFPRVFHFTRYSTWLISFLGYNAILESANHTNRTPLDLRLAAQAFTTDRSSVRYSRESDRSGNKSSLQQNVTEQILLFCAVSDIHSSALNAPLLATLSASFGSAA